MRYAGAWECAAGIGCVVVASIRPWTASLPSSSACLPGRRVGQFNGNGVSAHATSSRSASCLSVLAVCSDRCVGQYSTAAPSSPPSSSHCHSSSPPPQASRIVAVLLETLCIDIIIIAPGRLRVLRLLTSPRCPPWPPSPDPRDSSPDFPFRVLDLPWSSPNDERVAVIASVAPIDRISNLSSRRLPERRCSH